MSYTVAQLIANTREMMDATNSDRWTDAFITTALGVVHGSEYSSLLDANPYYTFQQITCTTDANGQIPYSSLSTGSGDSAKYLHRILAITDGTVVYRQTGFINVPLATSTNYDSPYQRLWYDAGSAIQLLPKTQTISATITVNYTPPRVDQLATTASIVDFPDGKEVILWLEAAAMLLEKGAAESPAAQQMRMMADELRDQMYKDLTRRAARPTYFGYPDTAAEWGGLGI